MRPSGYLTTRVGSLPAALIVCVLTAASVASAEQTPGGAGHAGEPLVLTGSGAGAGLSRAGSAVDGTAIFTSQPFGGGFSGGVYVASGDIDGDGRADVIVGAGSGGQIAAFSGADAHELERVLP